MSKIQRFSCVLAVLAIPAVACASDASNLEARGQHQHQHGYQTSEFFELFRGLHLDYIAHKNLTEMLRLADVVVTGRVSDVKEGRVIGSMRDERGGLRTAVLIIEVEELVAGHSADDSKTQIQVEVFRPVLTSIEALKESMPTELLLFSLVDLSRNPKTDVQDTTGATYDLNKSVYAMPTPKGAFMEVQGIVTPFDPEPAELNRSIKATTMAELVEEVRKSYPRG